MPQRGVSRDLEHPPTERTHVYVIEDHGQVVYVGLSHNPAARVAAHRRAFWWNDDMRMRSVLIATRSDAFVFEARLIAKIRPRWNTCHNPSRRALVERSEWRVAA